MIAQVEKNQPVTESAESTNHKAEIRIRAYELYVERDMENGYDVEDWLRAEAEVLSNNETSVA